MHERLFPLLLAHAVFLALPGRLSRGATCGFSRLLAMDEVLDEVRDDLRTINLPSIEISLAGRVGAAMRVIIALNAASPISWHG